MDLPDPAVIAAEAALDAARAEGQPYATLPVPAGEEPVTVLVYDCFRMGLLQALDLTVVHDAHLLLATDDPFSVRGFVAELHSLRDEARAAA